MLLYRLSAQFRALGGEGEDGTSAGWALPPMIAFFFEQG
jgi:hypothetical protein